MNRDFCKFEKLQKLEDERLTQETEKEKLISFEIVWRNLETKLLP